MLRTAVIGAGPADRTAPSVASGRVQIAIIRKAGVLLVLTGHAPWRAALWWWILGGAFVAGVYVFEWTVARRLARAQLGRRIAVARSLRA